MMPVSLEAFIHEYGLTFPIGVDEPGTGTPVPVTMDRYRMRGTPTSLLIGRDGTLLHHGFGQEDDMALGALIASALAGSCGSRLASGTKNYGGGTCDADGCGLPTGI